MIPAAEYAPDRPTLGESVAYVENVTPLTERSYGPVKQFQPVGAPLGKRAQGASSFRGPSGAIFNCAGDASSLYSWNGNFWTNISRTTGIPYATPAEDGWSFAQFGDLVVAVNGIDEPQLYNISIGDRFSALPGSPPIARFATTVRDFLFLGRLYGAENKIRWSAINDATSWSIGLDQSDEQEFVEGGRITGMIGGQYAIIFQETAIQRGTYVGPDLIFQFDVISRERGCAASGSIAAYQELVFFLAADGFFLLNGAIGEQPIGDQKVDRWFWSNVNESFLHRITATIDSKAKLYLVSFPSIASTDGTPDTILVYNWTIGRWSRIAQKVDMIFSAMNNLGLTLEGLDSITSSLDAFPYSLDSALLMGSPIKKVAGFGTDKRLGFFEGENMAAIIDTAEGELNPGARSLVRAIRPLIDGGNALVSLGTRNKLGEAIAWGEEVAQLENGECPARSHARYHRARMRIPAGELWSHALGIDVDAVEAGER